MLRSVKDMQAYTIRATDGTIGHVKDLYFDDDACAAVRRSSNITSRRATAISVTCRAC